MYACTQTNARANHKCVMTLKKKEARLDKQQQQQQKHKIRTEWRGKLFFILLESL